MADKKITDDPESPTPLTGNEIVPVVQGGENKRITIDNILEKANSELINGGEY